MVDEAKRLHYVNSPQISSEGDRSLQRFLPVVNRESGVFIARLHLLDKHNSPLSWTFKVHVF